MPHVSNLLESEMSVSCLTCTSVHLKKSALSTAEPSLNPPSFNSKVKIRELANWERKAQVLYRDMIGLSKDLSLSKEKRYQQKMTRAMVKTDRLRKSTP